MTVKTARNPGPRKEEQVELLIELQDGLVADLCELAEQQNSTIEDLIPRLLEQAVEAENDTEEE